jgi:hypothetical protein
MTSSPRGKSESPRPRKRSRSMARNGASEGSPRTRAERLIRGENLRSMMPEANGRGPEREP